MQNRNKTVYIQKTNLGKWERLQKIQSFGDFVNWCLEKYLDTYLKEKKEKTQL